MPVTRRPPHSPGRALLAYPVPRLYSLARRAIALCMHRVLMPLFRYPTGPDGCRILHPALRRWAQLPYPLPLLRHGWDVFRRRLRRALPHQPAQYHGHPAGPGDAAPAGLAPVPTPPPAMCMDARVPQAQDVQERPLPTRSRRCCDGLTGANCRQLLPASPRAPTFGALPPPSMESSVTPRCASRPTTAVA
jgi:hypothetical protein